MPTSTSPSTSNPHRTRTVPLQVLSLGLPRTGTASMRLALETLGYNPTMHAYEITDHPKSADAWLPLIRGKWETPDAAVTRDMFDAAIGKYAAVTDVPCAAFWEELVELYPEAKVVLVERNFENWLPSFKLVVDNVMGLPGTLVRYVIEPLSGHRVLYMHQLFYSYQWRGRNRRDILANARAVYAEHYAGIRAKVGKERLLEYKLGEGWEPLCEFLGKEEPDVAFPRVNDAEDFQRKVDETVRMYAVQAAKAVVWPGLIVGVAVVTWWLRGSFASWA